MRSGRPVASTLIDVGAEGGEDVGADGSGPPRGAVEDADAVEGQGSGGRSGVGGAGGVGGSATPAGRLPARRGRRPARVAGRRRRCRSGTAAGAGRSGRSGSGENTPRATNCVERGAPWRRSSTGPAGMRKRPAASSTSSVVRAVVHCWTAASNSSRRAKRLGDSRQLGVLEQVGPVDHHQEVLELGGAVGGEHGVAVGRGLDRRDLDDAGGGGRPVADRRSRRRPTGRSTIVTAMASSIGDVDVGAPAGQAGPCAARRARRGRRRCRSIHSPIRPPAANGVPSGSAALPVDPRRRLEGELGRGPVAPTGPSTPNGVTLTTTRPGSAARSRGTWSGSDGDDQVGGGRQGEQIAVDEPGRQVEVVVQGARSGAPQRVAAVAAPGRHDAGAGVGQHLGAVPPGDPGRHVQHSDPAQHR